MPRTAFSSRRENSLSTSSPAEWPWVSLIDLKKSMSRMRMLSGRPRTAACSASVPQAGQRIGDRRFDRHLNIVAQPLCVALLLDLSAHPRQELVRIDRADQ